MTEERASNVAYGTLVIVCNELRNDDTSQAERSLDWAVLILLDHCYTSIAWQLVDDFKHLLSLYFNGEKPSI